MNFARKKMLARFSGFTLIELLLYMTLASMSVVALAFVVQASLQSRSVAAAQIRLLERERVVEWTLRERLQEAGEVTLPASGTGTTLEVDSPTAGEDPVVFATSGTTLMMQLGAQAAVPLTPDDIRVTDFSVTRVNGTPASVRVDLTYETDTISTTISETSTVSFTLRYD